jgi:hypothetical protein
MLHTLFVKVAVGPGCNQGAIAPTEDYHERQRAIGAVSFQRVASSPQNLPQRGALL